MVAFVLAVCVRSGGAVVVCVVAPCVGVWACGRAVCGCGVALPRSGGACVRA